MEEERKANGKITAQTVSCKHPPQLTDCSIILAEVAMSDYFRQQRQQLQRQKMNWQLFR